MELNSIITDDTNLIEIFLSNKISTTDDVIDVSVDDAFVKTLISKYVNFKKNNYKSYSYNEMTYLYDLGDDNQIVYSKFMNKYKKISKHNINAFSYKYSKLPTQLFPCVKNIDDICEYTIMDYKFTNRLSLMIRIDEYGKTAYLEYKHSPNVDVEKVFNNINSIIEKIYS